MGTTTSTSESRNLARRRRLAFLAGTVIVFGWTAPAAAAQTAQQAISVPAGSLTPALNRLAAQSGLQILFDADLAQGKTTRGVRGNLTSAQALDAVLAGTGLSARRRPIRSARCSPPSATGR